MKTLAAILVLLFLSGCVTQTTQDRDPRLTVDCPLVPLPEGDVTSVDIGLTLLDQWVVVMGCTDRFRQLRNEE